MSSSPRWACLEPSQSHRLLTTFPRNLSRSCERAFHQAPGPMPDLIPIPSLRATTQTCGTGESRSHCLRDTEYRDATKEEKNPVQNRLHHCLSSLVLLCITKRHKLNSFKQCKWILSEVRRPKSGTLN